MAAAGHPRTGFVFGFWFFVFAKSLMLIPLNPPLEKGDLPSSVVPFLPPFAKGGQGGFAFIF
jgi:hypothetical protein